MNDSRHLNIIPKPQKINHPPIILLVLCSNALEHHAILKHITARERYVYKNEAYILGALNGQHNDLQLILREPGNRSTDLTANTLQAIQLFQPHFAFLLGLAAETGKAASGEVLISDTNHQSQTAAMAAAPETKGFFQALQANPEVPGKAILSIHKSTAGSTAQALNNLATVALSAWQQIDYKEFASDQWNSKQLAQDIFSRLFPFPEAVREIDHDFSAGFNKNYQEVWNLVKPLLKDELYAFQKNPKDWDNQTGVREKLRAALQHEKQLRLSLGTLLSQVACQPMG